MTYANSGSSQPAKPAAAPSANRIDMSQRKREKIKIESSAALLAAMAETRDYCQQNNIKALVRGGQRGTQECVVVMCAGAPTMPASIGGLPIELLGEDLSPKRVWPDYLRPVPSTVSGPAHQPA